jgi:hypothetical protein
MTVSQGGVRRESGLLRCGGGKAGWALCAKGEETVSEEQRGRGERAGVSMGIDTKENTLGGGAPQVGDLRLLEAGGERGGALVSDLVVVETAGEERSGGIGGAVASETASDGWGGGGERVGMSMGIDTKANTRAAAHISLVICVSLRMAASAEAPLSPILLPPRLRARDGERVGMSTGMTRRK